MTTVSHANDSFRTGLPRFQTVNMYKTKNRTAKSGSSAGTNGAAGGSSGLSSFSSLSRLAQFSSAMTLGGYSGLGSSAALSYLTGLYGSSALGSLAGLSSYAGLTASRTAGTQTGAWSSYSTLPPGGASETKWLGCSIDVEEHVFGETWEQVDEVPGYYELKDGKPLTWMGTEPDLEFRFYHAAESTEENPVLVARGADRYGRVFEQKIDVNKVNPYNATRMEMEALTTCHDTGDMDFSIPFLDYYENPKMDDRFDYINSLRAAVQTSRRLGFTRESRRYQEEVDYLLGFAKNHTAPNTAELNAANSKRNLELYTSAVRERFLSNMARKCSKDDLSEQFWFKEL